MNLLLIYVTSLESKRRYAEHKRKQLKFSTDPCMSLKVDDVVVSDRCQHYQR